MARLDFVSFFRFIRGNSDFIAASSPSHTKTLSMMLIASRTILIFLAQHTSTQQYWKKEAQKGNEPNITTLPGDWSPISGKHFEAGEWCINVKSTEICFNSQYAHYLFMILSGKVIRVIQRFFHKMVYVISLTPTEILHCHPLAIEAQYLGNTLRRASGA